MSKAIQFKNTEGENIYPCPYYPVGSIYLSVSPTDPGTIFGGVWEQIKEKFLIGAFDGGSYPCGKTGGTKSLFLQEENLPHINLDVAYTNTSGTQSYGAIGAGAFYLNANGSSHGKLGVFWEKEQKPVEIIPPYLAVYMWKRVK